MKRFALFLACALVAASSWAADLTVSGAWIRQLPAGAPAGGYFTLHNHGSRATELVGASSPDYAMVMLHKTVENGGTSTMVGVDSIELPAGGAISFSPGGYHLMLMHAKRRFELGSRVPVTLRFDDGRTLDADFEVRGPTGN